MLKRRTPLKIGKLTVVSVGVLRINSPLFRKIISYLNEDSRIKNGLFQSGILQLDSLKLSILIDLWL